MDQWLSFVTGVWDHPRVPLGVESRDKAADRALETFGPTGNSNSKSLLQHHFSRGNSFEPATNGTTHGFLFPGSGQVSTLNDTSSSHVTPAVPAAVHAHTHHHHHHHQFFGGGNSSGGSDISGIKLVALYDYSARHSCDVAFKKGDILQVINESDRDGWNVHVLRTGETGYVPRNFVKSLKPEDWFFGQISRQEAENRLMTEENPAGTFLIRYSEQHPGALALAVKDWEQGKGYHVKHYRTPPLDSGWAQTLCELITMYDLHLSHVLTKPCPKPFPQMWDLSPETRDQWEIDRNELQFIRKLCSGNFGEVWYGRCRNGMEVAIKTLRSGKLISTSAFLEEATIMKKFRHDNLVALYAVCSRDEPVCIVIEYMSNGSLLNFLRYGPGKNLKERDLAYIAAQVASGMVYLEEKQLIHRDLAARNVLVGDNNIVKICDFGLARVIVRDDEYLAREGSPFPTRWTAPEGILYGRFSVKSDIWSYGILLMELFTFGQVPYPGMNNSEVMDQVSKGYRMPQPTSGFVSDPVYGLMLRCWDAEPDRRPDFKFLNYFFENFPVLNSIFIPGGQP